MAKTTARITPPFSWLGPFTTGIVLAMTLILAAVFRFWRLTDVPPGLGGQVAASALQSVKLLEHGSLPGFNAANDYAPLWVWLQALPIKLLGATPYALRLWPALLGTLAVYAMWLWLAIWFGRRTAWIGALIIAVIPWTVTVSRSGSEAAALPLLVSLTFWLATLAWRSGKLLAIIGLILTLLADVFLGPLGWAIVAAVTLLGGFQLIHERRHQLINRMRIIGGALGITGLVAVAIVAANSQHELQQLPQVTHLTLNPFTVGANVASTLLMLFAPGSGDLNYQHNLAGQPLLNAFLGLMLIAGVLVSIARLQHRRYRWLLGSFLILLVPAVVTTVGIPNASRAIALAPVVAGITAVGVSYMLELWYSTFPINSAARSGGQAAIIVLLGLTVFLGYTQYFRAWAELNEVYVASNDGIVRLATNLKTDKFVGQRFVVAQTDIRDIIAYVSHGTSGYTALEPADITGLPTAAGPRQFFMTPATRNAAMKIIKTKFPGGVLRPHYSPFNQSEIYYSYEITQ